MRINERTCLRKFITTRFNWGSSPFQSTVFMNLCDKLASTPHDNDTRTMISLWGIYYRDGQRMIDFESSMRDPLWMQNFLNNLTPKK